jgi:hypothetical protein
VTQRGTLFDAGDLSDYLSRRRQTITEEIERYDRARFLNSPPPALVEHFVSKYQCDAPKLDETRLSADQGEAKVDVSQFPDRHVRDRSRPLFRPGTKISLFLPFEGEEELLQYTPSTRFMNGGVRAHVDDHRIVVEFLTDTLDEPALRRWKDDILSTIRQLAGWMTADVANWNRALPGIASTAIEARRDRLLRSQGLVASLGIPLVARSDAPRTYAVSSVVRRTVPAPPAPGTPFAPEPALAAEQFEQILSLIRPVGSTIERDPAAFASLDEESLRSLFLATLNSHYRGNATGETFNAQGKTDILIRENDRNIFIAECKIWRGAKSFSQALNQLLGYATWRDGKLALLLFVRQKGFSEVVGQISMLVNEHAAYRRGLQVREESEWHCTVASEVDPARERTLAILAFYCPASTRNVV